MQPINGTRNGIFVGLITSKEAIKNSILDAGFKGVDSNEIDFTVADLKFAYARVMGMYKDSVAGNVRANKTYIMAKRLDYLPDNFDWASNNNSLLTTGNNLIDQGTMYMFHTIPEEAHALTVMVAQLHRMKNLKTGKSMWDSYSEPYDIGNGVYDVKWEGGIRGVVMEAGQEIEIGEIDGLEARKMKRVYQRMQGNYRREERAALEAYILGQIFIQFRKYIGAMLFGSFGSRRNDQTLGYYKFTGDKSNGKDVMDWNARLIEGRWKVLAYTLMNVVGLRGHNQGTYSWDKLSTDQKGSVMTIVTSAAYMLAIYGAIAMMFDDDEEKDSFKLWMTHIAQNTGQQWDFFINRLRQLVFKSLRCCKFNLMTVFNDR